jgi:hypothetical protein
MNRTDLIHALRTALILTSILWAVMFALRVVFS